MAQTDVVANYVVRFFLSRLTPGLAAAAKEWLVALEKKAAATNNPYDDIFVGFLRDVLSELVD